MLNSILYTFIIDAEAVYYRSVTRDSETSRLRITILRLGGEGADFNETESEVGHIVIEFSILVKTSGKTYRVWELYSENLSGQGR